MTPNFDPCRYCGERPAEAPPGRRKQYRGRPCCLACRAAFESGARPAPARFRQSGACRNGPSDRQRHPAEASPVWDDAVRALEDSDPL